MAWGLVALVAAFFIVSPASASWIKEPRLLTYEVSAAKAKPRTALVRSGLMDDGGRFVSVVVSALQKQGYRVTHLPWWAAKSGSYTVEIGHSKGADKVLSDGGRNVIAIDPTIANRGCQPKSNCTAYYAPENRIPLIVCCGGYPARGAKNIRIARGHVQAPRIALAQILKQTARLK